MHVFAFADLTVQRRVTFAPPRQSPGRTPSFAREAEERGLKEERVNGVSNSASLEYE